MSKSHIDRRVHLNHYVDYFYPSKSYSSVGLKVLRSWGRGGGINWQSTEVSESSETFLCETIMMAACRSSKLMDYAPSRVSPNVNYGLWVIMCQRRFIKSNEGMALRGMLIVGGAVCMRAESTGEISMLLLNFAMHLK